MYRLLRYGYAFRKISLTRGKFAIVGPADYEKLNKYNWHALKCRDTFYAVRIGRKSEARRGKNIWMHRVVLGLDEGVICDHINHNGLDNRKANLRPATHSQNMCNRPKRKTKCRSKYKGVFWNDEKRKWQAQIKHKGRAIHIGYFDYEQDAAIAYDDYAIELFGEFAYLNHQHRPEIQKWLTENYLFEPAV